MKWNSCNQCLNVAHNSLFRDFAILFQLRFVVQGNREQFQTVVNVCFKFHQDHCHMEG